jgi:hypothetical protein
MDLTLEGKADSRGSSSVPRRSESKRAAEQNADEKQPKQRRSLKSVESEMKTTIDKLNKQLGNLKNESTQLKKKLSVAEKKVVDLVFENGALKTQVGVLKLLPGVAKFAANLREQNKDDTREVSEIYEADTDLTAKLCGALQLDWEGVNKQNIENQMEDDRYASTFICKIKQEVPKTALMAPDTFTYEAEWLMQQALYNKLDIKFCRDAESGCVSIKVKEWKSPVTREVFETGIFKLHVNAHQVFSLAREDLVDKLVQGFCQRVRAEMTVIPKTMKELAEMYEMEIVNV